MTRKRPNPVYIVNPPRAGTESFGFLLHARAESDRQDQHQSAFLSV